MNANNLDLQSLRNQRSAPQRKLLSTEDESDDDQCRCFGYLRGMVARAQSIEFRLANGNRVAFPYHWLGPSYYNPSAGILLRFVGDKVYLVLIEGSNLDMLINASLSLYERGILRHRVTFVREMTRQEIASSEKGEVTIERFRMLNHRSDDEPKGVEWLKPFQGQP